MSAKYIIIGSVFAVISGASFNYKLNQFGLLFTVLSIALFLCALIAHKKELKMVEESESSGFLKIESYGTDENTALVIKSIKYSDNGFINFGDIVNETNLSLKFINKALDWLVINKLATESRGRRGKTYELTPKGKDVFKSI
jgi:predicted transcriptional regulator